MAIQYYIKENQLSYGSKYYAKTVYSENLFDEDLLAYMLKKNTAMSETELKGVLDLLKQSLEELMKKGCRVILRDLISIYPVVRANFDTSDQAFHHGSGHIKVRSIVSRALSNEVKKNANVVKQGSGKFSPTLKDVLSGKERKNEVRWPYSTTVIGANLNPLDRDIELIRIINQDNLDQEFVIHAEQLIMDSQSDKELSFSIAQDITVPEWLTPELPILLQVQYPGGKDLLPVSSNGVKSFWLKAPETTNMDTEENQAADEIEA